MCHIWSVRGHTDDGPAKAKKLTARREAADKLTSPERLTTLAKGSHALARIVAKNPSTPISLLRDLSRSEEEATRKSVIRAESVQVVSRAVSSAG